MIHSKGDSILREMMMIVMMIVIVIAEEKKGDCEPSKQSERE